MRAKKNLLSTGTPWTLFRHVPLSKKKYILQAGWEVCSGGWLDSIAISEKISLDFLKMVGQQQTKHAKEKYIKYITSI